MESPCDCGIEHPVSISHGVSYLVKPTENRPLGRHRRRWEDNIKSRRLRWAGYVARMEESRSAFKILAGKPTGKRPLGRPKSRWEDNIRIDLKEIGLIPLAIGIIGEHL